MLHTWLWEPLQAVAARLLVVCLALTATDVPSLHWRHEANIGPNQNLTISALDHDTGAVFADSTRKPTDGNDLPKAFAAGHAPAGPNENASRVPHQSSDDIPQDPLLGSAQIRAPPPPIQI